MLKRSATRLAFLAVAAPMLAASTMPASAEYICKVKEYTGQHSCPKPSCEEVHRLDYKTYVHVYESKGKWHRVTTREQGWEGWVLSHYICANDYQGDDTYAGDQDHVEEDSGSTY